ncbi:hypothetical protein [Actinocorallia longicatena]|uniref:EF-hand domain-containing protein n=1 Tax=Actinocorallia longicatena TaxID=111803 RepID=A0ABP6QP49_9ACTN
MRIEERRARLVTRFGRLDLEKHGRLDHADAASAARRLSEGVGRTAGCREERLLEAALRQVWDAVCDGRFEPVDSARFAWSVDRYGRAVAVAVQAAADATFDLADLDGHGRLNLREYAALCFACGVPDFEIIDGFERMAPDGLLARDRFREATLRYWLGYDS